MISARGLVVPLLAALIAAAEVQVCAPPPASAAQEPRRSDQTQVAQATQRRSATRARARRGTKRAPAAAAAAQSTQAAAPGGDSVRETLDGLSQKVDALSAQLAGADASGNVSAAAPRWAQEMQTQTDGRIERLTIIVERIAARIETPTPRLDEPIILFTVAGATLLLGFLLGRSMQRRRDRRDGRFRL